MYVCMYVFFIKAIKIQNRSKKKKKKKMVVSLFLYSNRFQFRYHSKTTSLNKVKTLFKRQVTNQ